MKRRQLLYWGGISGIGLALGSHSVIVIAANANDSLSFRFVALGDERLNTLRLIIVIPISKI